MIIEGWSEKIAVSINNVDDKKTASVAVMKFALIILFNYSIPVFLSLIIGAICGTFMGTLLSITTFTVIRMLSGGYHFKSSSVCMSAMVIIAVVPPFVHLPEIWIMSLNLLSIVLVLLLAPSNMRGYHRMPEKFYPLMRIASAFLVVSNFAIASEILALVFAIQAISLIGWKEV
jgi:accessory gene regulator B